MPSAQLSSQLSSQLTPLYWRRRDPPVYLRCPPLSSLLSSALSSHLPIGDDGIRQCTSDALRSAHCSAQLSAHTSLLATTGSASVPLMPSAQLTAQLSSQLTPLYWRRRDPPVYLRGGDLSSPLSSAHCSAQLSAHTS